MREERTPIDQAQRDRIIHDRGATLFVEAGAGSGKTRALVDRVEALVLTDGIPMESIAAITFTEKAAAELRDRIRQRFESAATGAGIPAEPDAASDAGVQRRARAGEALAQLDGAAVGTLHSFAQRILNEYPVEAGLPPASRCSTRSAPRWSSRPSGTWSSTRSSTTRASGARSWPWRQPGFGSTPCVSSPSR
ncbi:MAG: UvrD-helicase domain-containing protein [Acidimicrobiales bacterium]